MVLSITARKDRTAVPERLNMISSSKSYSALSKETARPPPRSGDVSRDLALRSPYPETEAFVAVIQLCGLRLSQARGGFNT